MPWKRHVTFLLISQGISLLGSSIVQFAMIWHITLTTKSGSAIALASLAALLPLVIVSPLAGVWADRFNRRVITVAADAAVAAATAGIFVAFVLGHRSLVLMCAVLAIRSCATAFQSPAVTALLPGFVPEAHLTRINGLSGSVQALSNILGPALGGVALALMPLHMVFLIDITTAIIGITLFWFFVKVPAYGDNRENIGTWNHEFLVGLRYIKGHEFYGPLLVFFAVSMAAISAPAFLANLHVAREFGADTWRLSVVETTYGVGAALGGGLVALWPGLRREISTIAYAIAVMGLTFILLALAPSFVVFTVIMGLLGVVIPYLNAPAITLFQRTCDPQHLGKLMSIVIMLNGAFLPLGIVVFGPLADRIPIWIIMVLGGIIELGVCAGILAHPRLRAVEGPASRQ